MYNSQKDRWGTAGWAHNEQIDSVYSGAMVKSSPQPVVIIQHNEICTFIWEVEVNVEKNIQQSAMKDAADTVLIAKRHHLQYAIFFQSTKSAFRFGGNVLSTTEKSRSFFRACMDKPLETISLTKRSLRFMSYTYPLKPEKTVKKRELTLSRGYILLSL